MAHFTATGLLKIAALGAVAAFGLPFQFMALKLKLRMAHHIPVWFHRASCQIMRVKVHETGQRPQIGVATLVVSNHVSWLDISVIGTTRPLAFVAKAEVKSWPGFGLLAKMQRTVFVDRTRRSATSATTAEMGNRLENSEAVVLFAEGTTSDGSRILPFKSALLGAVREALGENAEAELVVQPLSIVYRGRHGIAEGRRGRAELAWAGETKLVPHLATVLNSGPIDVHLVWGSPIRASSQDSRKTITAAAEKQVRIGFSRAIRQ